MRSSVALLLLTGCLEGDVALFGCPPDEVCSPDAPDGLLFFGASLSGGLGLPPETTAVGGIQHVRLKREVAQYTYEDLATTYFATGGAALAVDDTEGPVVTLRGVAPGGNYLEIRDRDDALLDRKFYRASPIARIAVVPEHLEKTARPLGFLAGASRIGIGLYAAPIDGYEERVVDEAMSIEAPGATRVTWDLIEVPAALPGTFSISVNAGDRSATTVEAELVLDVDAIVEQPLEQPLVVGEYASLCFDAVSGERHVANLAWTFSEGSLPSSFLASNCAFVHPEVEGELVITATAEGRSRTVTYPVGPAPMQKPRPAPAPAAGFARGDRATAAASSSR